MSQKDKHNDLKITFISQQSLLLGTLQKTAAKCRAEISRATGDEGGREREHEGSSMCWSIRSENKWLCVYVVGQWGTLKHWHHTVERHMYCGWWCVTDSVARQLPHTIQPEVKWNKASSYGDPLGTWSYDPILKVVGVGGTYCGLVTLSDPPLPPPHTQTHTHLYAHTQTERL